MGDKGSNEVGIWTAETEYSYNDDIDWGDNNTDTGVTGNITHSYATAGTYTISISGKFPSFISGSASDANKLLTIEEWGDIQWESMANTFDSCTALTSNATYAPNLSQVTTMRSMFFRAIAFNQPLNTWNVSAVTNMSFMFYSATVFNQNLSTWTVTLVSSYAYFFGEGSTGTEPTWVK